MHGVARDTWRLFERCVDASSHHLPPDNLQTAPYEMVAHRTSPTNIGLYLLSASCARRFGWIGTLELLDRLEATLATLQVMERHRGHFLNWYDTETLQPLHPRYVSTVDSGNLCAHLVAVAQACHALATQPLSPRAGEQAIRASQARLQPRLGIHHPGMRGLHHPSALSRLLGMRPPDAAHLPEATAFRALLAQAQDELRSMAQPRHPAIVHLSLIHI